MGVYPDSPSVRPNRSSAAPRVGLSWLERSATTSAAPDGHAQAIVDLAEDFATALSGEDGDACRARTIARLIASEKTGLETLRTALGGVIAAGRYADAKLVDRLVSESCKRLVHLLDQHRVERGRTAPKSLVLIQHAEAVQMTSDSEEG